MENQQGIYFIRSIVNGHEYVGSSKSLNKRNRRHFSELRNKKHKNAHLQNAFNKYGESNFVFGIIERVNDECQLTIKEQYYIDQRKPFYNINKKAASSLGVKRRSETIEKIRQANIGLKHPEWRNQIKSKAQGGNNHWTKKKKFSETSKKKMSDSHKKLYAEGYVHPRSGVKDTPEQREQKRQRLLGKPSLKKIKVYQYTKNMEFIAEYPSIKEATQITGIKGIGNVLCGLAKTAGGYIWQTS